MIHIFKIPGLSLWVLWREGRRRVLLSRRSRSQHFAIQRIGGTAWQVMASFFIPKVVDVRFIKKWHENYNPSLTIFSKIRSLSPPPPMGPRGEAKADILQSRDQSSFRLWKVNRTEKRDFYANVISITFWSLPDFWGQKVGMTDGTYLNGIS